MLDEIQTLAVSAALGKMMQSGWMDITCIDKILKMTGGIPDRKDYEILHILHCVHFCDMDPTLRRGLPVILTRVLGSEPMELCVDLKLLQ